MKRRSFLAGLASLPLAGGFGFLRQASGQEAAPVAPTIKPGWRRFEVTTRVTLPGGPRAAQVFLPLAQSAGDYQAVLESHWQGTGRTECVHDLRYGAAVLRSDWRGGETGARTLAAVQIVTTRDREPSAMLPLTEAERTFWTAPTASAPVDGIVLETATRITVGKTSPREQVRALYDWVVDHTHRDPDTPGCGTGDFRASLARGQLGGKCADINSLLVGLARAAGFPAREVYGLRVAGSSRYPSLGRSGDVSKAQHCRAEVFLAEEGWFPVDPADVRKVVLEQKVSLDSAEGRALRERMFGHWEMNWVGYNSATDLVLPGGESQHPAFCFLMYPCGFDETGQLPCLDPARFHYEIQAREVTA